MIRSMCCTVLFGETNVLSGLCFGRMCMCFVCVVFFQAEDGIRDLVRSRGLGDVYKRQVKPLPRLTMARDTVLCNGQTTNLVVSMNLPGFVPVSYTHLTLPTSDLV